jgi:prephenate dehydrogenase
MPIETIAILGVGLIGGSFGLALRQAGFAGRLIGVSSERTIQSALERGVIDVGAPIHEALPKADLIYLAQPISKIIELLPEVHRLAPEHALVTDVGSTKVEIVSRAAELFGEGPFFVGGHPMAGKEGRGVAIADATLFRGAAYALTPLHDELPKSEVVNSFLQYLEKFGAKVHVLTATGHDQIVSWTSHMPQLASTALAATVLDAFRDNEGLALAGSGLRDMTRLAESPFEIWSDILDTNRDNLQRVLSAYIARLESMLQSLDSTGLAKQFEEANALRQKLLKRDI